jgi:hypothetical protein
MIRSQKLVWRCAHVGGRRSGGHVSTYSRVSRWGSLLSLVIKRRVMDELILSQQRTILGGSTQCYACISRRQKKTVTSRNNCQPDVANRNTRLQHADDPRPDGHGVLGGSDHVQHSATRATQRLPRSLRHNPSTPSHPHSATKPDVDNGIELPGLNLFSGSLGAQC